MSLGGEPGGPPRGTPCHPLRVGAPSAFAALETPKAARLSVEVADINKAVK